MPHMKEFLQKYFQFAFSNHFCTITNCQSAYKKLERIMKKIVLNTKFTDIPGENKKIKSF